MTNSTSTTTDEDQEDESDDEIEKNLLENWDQIFDSIEEDNSDIDDTDTINYF